MGHPSFKTAAWIRLGNQHQPTRRRLKTKAYSASAGRLLEDPPAKVLMLLTSDTDERCYLSYCDEEGTPINDSLLDNVEEAMAVAETGYRVRSTEWQWSPWPGKEVWSVLVWTGEEGSVDSSKPHPKRGKTRPGKPLN